MEHEEKDSINARSGEVSGVDGKTGAEAALDKVMPAIEAAQDKPKHGGGPKPKGYYQADVSEVLNNSARTAARVLQEHIDQKKGRRTLKSSLQRACEYVIDHAVGKSRQKVIISGGVLGYGELAKSAEDLDNKPRPVLADAFEVAHKYQDKTPVKDGGSGPNTPNKEENKSS